MSAPDIFLSYNREDSVIARTYADAFAAAGLEVWWDQTLKSGEAYDKVTEDALRGAKAVVVLWSPRSVESRWVRIEATIADRKGTLMPVTIEPCERPIMFELTQAAELSHWRGDGEDAAWQAFLGDVRRKVGAKTEPAVQSAVEWGGAAPVRGHRPALAILPFVSRSGDDEDEDFAEELVEDLSLALSFSPWMEVIAASKTAAYRGGAQDLRQIGRDLSAYYLLEGKMRRAGERLRITVQLVAAEEGRVLWTQKFDEPHAETGAAQEELATAISVQLGAKIERFEQEYALRKSVNLTPWESFVRAVAHQGRGTRAGYEAAVIEARRALEVDPEFAYAYSVMLAALGPLTVYRDDEQELAREIVETIRRVRALAPDDPVVLAGCLTGLNALGRPQEALPFAERAVAINPNIDYVRFGLGGTLLHLGRLQEALDEFDAGDRIAADVIRDHYHAAAHAAAHLHGGHLDLALEAAERAVRKLVCPESLMEFALCRALAGDRAGAIDAMCQIRESDPEIARRHIEKLVRYFHFGSSEVDEYVAIVCGLWDETGGDR